jgi:outer membrane immunogenic protein
MRKFLLGTAALIASIGPSIAADLRMPVTPAVVPAWNWTGCYLGGHVGGLWASQKDWVVRTPGGDFYGQSLGSHDVENWVGGAQVGCDYQFANRFVLGLQGDYAWTNASGEHDSELETGVSYHSKVKSLATFTGRIGYAWDRFLGYVKGGGAWERNDYSAATIILGTAYTSQETRAGWTIGVGGEYAFTSFLSGFVEYNFYDFGNREIAFTPQVAGLRPAFVEIRETKGVVRAGLNVRFGGFDAPVAAKY